MKLIVSGAHSFSNQPLLADILNKYTKYHKISAIVVGQEPGIETMTVEWAMKNKVKLNIIPTKNESYKMRNQRLAETHNDAKAILHFKGSPISEDLCQRLQAKRVPIDDVILDS